MHDIHRSINIINQVSAPYKKYIHLLNKHKTKNLTIQTGSSELFKHFKENYNYYDISLPLIFSKSKTQSVSLICLC